MKTQQQSYIVSILILFIFFLPFTTFADIDDNTTQWQNLRDRIGVVQGTQVGLPTGVSEPKGRIGYILSNLFNSSGHIPNIALKAFSGSVRTNNNLLKWRGGNGGGFGQSQLYDDGTTIGLGGAADAPSLQVDVTGAIGANQYCDGNGNNCFSPSAVSSSGGTVGGTGTAGYITRFTGPSTIADSVMQDNGTNVGIGVAPSSDRLRVNGVARIDGGVSVDGRTAISGTNYSHTARSTANDRYGFFEVRRDDDTRGAYFGYGNGTNTVNLYLDNANTLNVSGGLLRLDRSTGNDLLGWQGGGMRRMTDQGGFSLGTDSSILFHAGDNRVNLISDLGITSATTNESLFLTADSEVRIITGRQNDYASSKAFRFHASGNANFPGSITLGTEGTASNHLVTKGYVDTAVAGAGSLWSVNGSEIYYNTANVGIGTNDPATTLDVSGDIRSGTVATNCVGNCPATAAPPVSGDWGVSGNLNVNGTTTTAGITVNGTNSTTGKIHVSRDGLGECCSGGDFTMSIAEHTSVTGKTSRIQFHNGGYDEGFIELAGGATPGGGYRRFRISDHQGSLTALEINGHAPTVYFRDTNARSGMVHVNSNIMYFLRGCGTNSNSWCTHNSRWPLELHLNNNNAVFGGSLWSHGYHHHSDRTLKTNIFPINSAVKKIQQLNGYNFTWKDTQNASIGIIAQEVQEVFPEIVSDFTDTETGEQTKSVEYSLLIAPLIEATKEQQLQIEELEERIVQLEKLLEELMK